MKCPKCGRFSKVRISEEKGKVIIYSDCSFCGMINIERKDIEKVIEEETDYVKMFKEADFVKMLKETDHVRILFAVFSTILLVTSAVLYVRVEEGNTNIAYARLIIEEIEDRYYALEDDYLLLLNTSSSLEDYYAELQEMYSTLRSEYSDLEDLHSSLAQEKADLQDDYLDLIDDKNSIQKELDDILSFSKMIILERNATYELPAGGNMTLPYNISYAGYIEVNFTSSTDIYIWVGSSISENGYYARYPAFPHTAFNGTFSVPVCVNLYLFIVNTNIGLGTNVTLTMEYTY